MKKEVKIKIKGKDYIFPYGLGFLGQCLENLGLSVSEMGENVEKNPFKWSPILMYESLKYRYGDKIKFDLKEFISILDNDVDGMSKVGVFNRAFILSLLHNLPKEDVDGADNLKKKINWNGEIISFALMELGCPSMKYVNEMTWAEFQIRAYGFKRMQEREELLFREVAYNSYIGGSLMLKKIPSRNQFWRIGNKKSNLTEQMRERILQVQEQYKRDLEKVNNSD